jgi:hypothetical protein
MNSIYPQPLRQRPELNLRQGIKPSMPNLKELVALVLSLYLVDPKSVLSYGNPQSGGRVILEDELKADLLDFFTEEIKSPKTNVAQFSAALNYNPLLTAQMEPLQVAAELYFKLCRISFINGAASSIERTGGSRYSKQLHFTTNCEVIRISFAPQTIKPVLFNWIMGSLAGPEAAATEQKLTRLLTIFSEETQFKIRQLDGPELYFQQEGIYQKLLEVPVVDSQDAHESVGPFRILKSAIKSGLHAYLKNDEGFARNDRTDLVPLEIYKGLVSNTLDISPKKTTIILTEPFRGDTYFHLNDSLLSSSVADSIPHNKILFGPPGTGKSSKIKHDYASGHKQRRVTFHPDYEHASFVGSYKPKTDSCGKIRYEFVPQEFIRAYTDAWNDPEHRYFLIIEEINRGACAQIFGDLFQSLDRDQYGFSEYEIDADTDLADHLTNFFSQNATAASRLSGQLQKRGCPADAFNKIILPNNLYLYATMNTSDQSLFPMDSAFKRRWDWEYIPIDYHPKDEDGEEVEFTIILDNQERYDWAEFITQANARIYQATQSEDKQLGFWFVKPKDGSTITESEFKSKVLFYLWFDVFRNEPDRSIFPSTIGKESQPFGYGHLFDSKTKDEVLAAILTQLGIPQL